MSLCVVLLSVSIAISYSQSCITPKLVLDTTYNELCNGKCNECLNYIHVNLDHLVMNTSTSISSIESPTDSSCTCPSYSLLLLEDNKYRVSRGCRSVSIGTLELATDRIKLQLNAWECSIIRNSCIQYYLPNELDLMTVQSYAGTLYYIYLYIRCSCTNDHCKIYRLRFHHHLQHRIKASLLQFGSQQYHH